MKTNQKGNVLVVLLVLAVIILVLALLMAPFFGGLMPNYSDGERTGTIYKFSKKGLVWKSWEGEMYLGGVSLTSGDNPTLQMDKFRFSMPIDGDTETIKAIQDCASQRKLCTIHYSEYFIGPVWQDTGYTVTGVTSN